MNEEQAEILLRLIKTIEFKTGNEAKINSFHDNKEEINIRLKIQIPEQREYKESDNNEN